MNLGDALILHQLGGEALDLGRDQVLGGLQVADVDGGLQHVVLLLGNANVDLVFRHDLEPSC